MRRLLEDQSDLCVRTILINDELRELRRERDGLRNQLERVAGELAAVETQHATLTSLYVAAHQLHETVNRASVLSRLEEIIVNFVGSEEFGVYERTAGDELRRIAQVGFRDDGDPRESDDVAARIPLEIDGRLVGYIAIYRLLPHKPALEPVDLELFDLLKTHAAAALLASRPSHDAP